MFIGERINQIRKEKNISLVELSKMSSVQVATLSRIENKKMVGTLESHINIAKALGIDITELYRNIDTSTTNDPIQSDPVEIFAKSNSSSIEILTKDVMKKRMMPMLIHLKSKTKTQLEQYKYGTERFVYMFKGNAQVSINKKIYEIKPGSSIYFDASSSHYFINPTKENITILCVTSPVSL